MKFNGMLVTVASLLMAGCASQPPVYTEHDPRIVGSWYIAEDALPYFNSYFEKTYFADGTSCGFEMDNDSKGTHISFFKDLWMVKDGKLISTPTSSNLEGVPVGVPIVDTIVAVTPTVMTLRAIEGGEPYNRYRYPEERGDMLCHLEDLSSQNKSGS